MWEAQEVGADYIVMGAEGMSRLESVIVGNVAQEVLRRADRTVLLPREEHRAGHSEASDFVRWGRRGGCETLRRYGRPWFRLLARRRWRKISAPELAAAFGGLS